MTVTNSEYQRSARVNRARFGFRASVFSGHSRSGFRHFLTLFLLLISIGRASTNSAYKITVLDEQTGRGVPLVELRTVNHISSWTDSNGIIAFDDPGLMDQDVDFHVKGHGYEYPKDGFGNRGLKLKPLKGGTATIRIKRLNIAERLYRVTGEGIYRDSVLVGQAVPLQNSVLNGQVTG